MARATLRSVGLDLAGSPSRTTGFCLLEGPWSTRTLPLHDDAEVIDTTLDARPQIVCIDAPLSLPTGRKGLEVPGPPHFRACDLELRRWGIPFFPLTLGPMRMLTARGLKIRQALEDAGVRVLESYPGGVQDMVGIPRKGEGVGALQRSMVRRGFRGDVARKGISHDELDAVACAWVGRLVLQGRAALLGDPAEGQIALPSLALATPAFRRRLRERERAREARAGPARAAPPGPRVKWNTTSKRRASR